MHGHAAAWYTPMVVVRTDLDQWPEEERLFSSGVVRLGAVARSKVAL